jgi:hypothetical protein
MAETRKPAPTTDAPPPCALYLGQTVRVDEHSHYGTQVEIDVCTTCGCVVGDTDTHDRQGPCAAFRAAAAATTPAGAAG